MIKVSVVIVCMNNLKNLYPCLDSIKKYTMLSYETLVVAYLFTPKNLARVKADYHWVTFIESNEIRGFSENNNLALRQVKGKYCFVLNDDTEMKMDVIGRLVQTIECLSEKVAIVSPTLLYGNGEVQCCGRPPIDWWHGVILKKLHLWNEAHGKYVNQRGIFKSYNILGAAFLIKTDIFKQVGWFDEYYFFSPEDIALSTLLNEKGYECYVNSDVKIIHNGGMTGKSLSLVQTATRPATVRGELWFFAKGSKLKFAVINICSVIFRVPSYVYFIVKGWNKPKPNIYSVIAKGELNVLKSSFNNQSPKEIFIKYYNELKG